MLRTLGCEMEFLIERTGLSETLPSPPVKQRARLPAQLRRTQTIGIAVDAPYLSPVHREAQRRSLWQRFLPPLRYQPFLPRFDIYQGDCLDAMPTWPARAAQVCITSPPYYRKARDYGVPPSDWPAVTYVPMVGTIEAGTKAGRGSDVRACMDEVSGRGTDYWECTGKRNLRSVWAIGADPSGWQMCTSCATIYTAAQFRFLCREDAGGSLRVYCNCGAWSWHSHLATFPPRLVEPCVRASTSERGCCSACGAPCVRVRSRRPGQVDTGDWRRSCTCGGGRRPCVVIDPFCGSGTTGEVACALRRHFWGI